MEQGPVAERWDRRLMRSSRALDGPGTNRPERHVRIAYTRSMEELEDGVRRIAKLVGR